MRLILTVFVKATLRPGANFGAPGLWSRVARRGRRALRNCTATHLLAPYGVAAVNDTRTVLGWQPIPCLSQWQPGGRGKALLTLARAARPEGRGGDSQEAGGTKVPPPLVRSVAAQATFPPAKSRHARLSCWMNRQPHRSPGAHCAPLRGSAPRSSRPTKLRGNSPSHALRNMDDTPRRPLISSYVTAHAQIRVSDTKRLRNALFRSLFLLCLMLGGTTPAPYSPAGRDRGTPLPRRARTRPRCGIF